MNRTRAWCTMALLAAWPMAAGASSGLHFPPDAVVVSSGGTLLVARLDPEDDRWLSLCVEGRDGALDFPVRELDRFGALFDARLHWESSGGIVVDPTVEPIPVDDEVSEIPDEAMRFQRVASLAFQTSKDRRDEDGNVDYWQMRLIVTWMDGKLESRAKGEANPAERDGTLLPDAASQRFEFDVGFRPGGHCRLPDFRR